MHIEIGWISQIGSGINLSIFTFSCSMHTQTQTPFPFFSAMTNLRVTVVHHQNQKKYAAAIAKRFKNMISQTKLEWLIPSGMGGGDQTCVLVLHVCISLSWASVLCPFGTLRQLLPSLRRTPNYSEITTSRRSSADFKLILD